MSWLLGGTALIALTGLISLPVAAQVSPQMPKGGTPAHDALAQAAVQRNFNIPAQSLATALTLFGEQAGMQITVDTALLTGRTSQTVSGLLAPEEALRRLLTGSGISWRFADPATLVLSRADVTPGVIALDPVTVQGLRLSPRQAEIGNLPPAYAGGQVARGSKVGVLGNKDMMDTPFTYSAYTAQLMQDQQARFVSEVLKNDPTARAMSRATANDGFNFRGFTVFNDDVLFNGLQGVAPSALDTVAAESFERVEVIKGANAALNGMVGGSVSGVMNVVPKRAGDAPLTQFTPDFTVGSQFGGHADVGRRFGKAKEFGVRLNGVYRNGDTPIDRLSRQGRVASIGYDYRGERLRLDGDFGYQRNVVRGMRREISLTAGIPVPKAPNSRNNWAYREEFSDGEVYYGAIRGEYDVTEGLTAFAAIGASEREQIRLFPNRTITSASGNIAAGNMSYGANSFNSRTGLSMEGGARGRFYTGPMMHEMLVAYTYYGLNGKAAPASAATAAFPASNIYTPAFGSLTTLTPPGFGAARRQFEQRQTSGTIANTMSILNERVQLIGAIRMQRIDYTGFNTTTGARNSAYDDSAVSPMVGLVLKPRRDVSLYANYIEGLEMGGTAPAGTVNAGEIFPPYVTKQYETGVKVDFGAIGTTVALYEVARPSGFTNPGNNTYGVNGEQRHRGVDFNIFGEVVPGIRLLGGVAYIDSVLTKTQSGTNDGKRGIAAPEWRGILGAEWDLPYLEGLTLTARLTQNGPQFLDQANRQEVPSYTLVDLGARYRFQRSNGQPIVIRANLDNALDANYWDTSRGTLILNDPMTFTVSTSFNF